MFACRGDKTTKLPCSSAAVIQWSGAISTTRSVRSDRNPMAVLVSDFMTASGKAFFVR